MRSLALAILALFASGCGVLGCVDTLLMHTSREYRQASELGDACNQLGGVLTVLKSDPQEIDRDFMRSRAEGTKTGLFAANDAGYGYFVPDDDPPTSVTWEGWKRQFKENLDVLDEHLVAAGHSANADLNAIALELRRQSARLRAFLLTAGNYGDARPLVSEVEETFNRVNGMMFEYTAKIGRDNEKARREIERR